MTTLVELAYHNALAFQELKDGLIHARRDAGFTRAQVAERLGLEESAVVAIESEGSNQTISTMRAYATAVHAKVTITVETVEVENEPITQGRTCGGDSDCATVDCSGNTDYGCRSDYTKGELMTPACREGGHEYCPAKYTPMTCNCNCHEEEN